MSLMTYIESEVILVLLVDFIRKVFSCRLWQFILLIKNVEYSRSLPLDEVCLYQNNQLYRLLLTAAEATA